MKKTPKKLLWIFIPIGAVLAAIILGLLLLIGLALIGGFFLLLPSLQQGGSESLFPDTSITAPATNPTEPAHIHQWQDANCTTPKTCSACGATEGKPAGHNYESVVTEPTFEDYGYTTYTCTHCGDHYEDDYIDPIKLRYDAGTLVFCTDGVAYLIGEDHQIMEAYTGWETETYYYYHNDAPWQERRLEIISVVIEDGVSPESTDFWFYEFENLERVKIGNAVTTIGEWAFYGCTSLTSITIPDSVTTIGENAFDYCPSLTRITIPDSVTTIGNYAFDGCTSLTSITIPDSVTTIGNYAFADCTSMTSVTIPEGVTTINDSAFRWCASLTSITIPDSVTTIDYAAFAGCTSLTSITIPDSVTTIGNVAFNSCTSLTSITIPDSVTTIGDLAFEYCTSLTSITIPEGVTTIGEYAFSDCTGLTSITFEGTVAEWNAIQKDFWWNNRVPATEVICSDGVVKL